MKIEINSPIQFKPTTPLLFLALVLACFALLPAPNAFGVSPAPDGGYAGNNTAEGTSALFSLTSGIDNTGLGFQSLFHDTTGSYNTATGYRALFNDTSGYSNTADGYEALYSDTTGIRNTAVGNGALLHNNASSNTAIGWAALFSNTTGTFNTANGVSALYSNTTGSRNTANGAGALQSNTTGFDNTANGLSALFRNTMGNRNTATGVNALISNTTGYRNTANGVSALFSNTDGVDNTAIGFEALFNNTSDGNTANGYHALVSNTTGSSNTAIGDQALYSNTTGSGNIALGISAGFALTTGSNNIHIGNAGNSSDSGTIRIGVAGTQSFTYIAGISGVNEGGTPSAVYINSNGQLGTQPPASSLRFKKEIKAMDKASEAILGLKPVTFHYKSDSTDTPQFGLIAEEVARVNPDLIVRDEKGEIYTVRYDAVNAMLLNEFLKEHRRVEQQGRDLQEQKAVNTELRSTIAQQQAEIKALAAGQQEQAAQIQNVKAQLELSRTKPQIVNNGE